MTRRRDLRPFLAANLFDHFVESHVAHIDEILRALSHCADPVADFQSTAGLRGTAGTPGSRFCIAILAPQHGANADKREPHVDAEVLQVGALRYSEVRIVGLGQSVEKKLYLLSLSSSCTVAQHAIVTPLDQFRAGSIGCSLSFSWSNSFSHALSPESISFGVVLWPGRFLAAYEDGIVRLEIHRLLDQLLDLRHPIFDSLLENVENFVRRFEISERISSSSLVRVFLRESVDIFLGKKEMAEIEDLEIPVSKLARNLVAQRVVGVDGLPRAGARPRGRPARISNFAESGCA
jgi:hypothetical protein